MKQVVSFLVAFVVLVASVGIAYSADVNDKDYAKELITDSVIGQVLNDAGTEEDSLKSSGELSKTDTGDASGGIKGQLQPVKYATISSEIDGSIVAINVSDSDSFTKGDTLVEFRCNVERAQLKKAAAVQKADRARVDVNERLDKLSSISELDYKLAVFKAEESVADVAVISERVKYCKITAPYSGVVEEVLRKNNEYVNRGDPVVKILDDSVLEIELLVSSDWITWLKKGLKFDVNVSELNKSYQAEITNIGAKIDPVSQSIKIKGAISNKEKTLKPGMSITAYFKR